MSAFLCAGAIPTVGSFGRGTGPIFLTNVACFGNEPTLLDCQSSGVTIANCNHTRDVGVICSLGEFLNVTKWWHTLCNYVVTTRTNCCKVLKGTCVDLINFPRGHMEHRCCPMLPEGTDVSHAARCCPVLPEGTGVVCVARGHRCCCISVTRGHMCCWHQC